MMIVSLLLVFVIASLVSLYIDNTKSEYVCEYLAATTQYLHVRYKCIDSVFWKTLKVHFLPNDNGIEIIKSGELETQLGMEKFLKKLYPCDGKVYYCD